MGCELMVVSYVRWDGFWCGFIPYFKGILLLSEGDQASFVIPSHLGYGERGAGGVIPPNATLVFDVELVQAK